MTPMRLCLVAALCCSSFLVTGCLVLTRELPAGTGPISDDRLVGEWQSLEDCEGKDVIGYMHVQKLGSDRPMRVVGVEDTTYGVYEVYTTRFGTRNIFAATVIAPASGGEDDSLGGYILGRYEIKGDVLSYRMFDGEKVREFVARGVITATSTPGRFGTTTLTGTPAELARFLASPAADSALDKERQCMRRLRYRRP